MKPMHGLRNRLARRLGMHANMTGLFHFREAVRSGSSQVVNRSMASGTNTAGLPLAKAFLPPPELAEKEALVPSVVQGAAPESPVEGSRPGPAQIKASPPASPGNVFRAPETEHLASPTSAEKTQPSDDDHVWNRLQNIFNKHKHKNISQGGASNPQPPERAAIPPHQTAEVETGGAGTSPMPGSPTGNAPAVPASEPSPPLSSGDVFRAPETEHVASPTSVENSRPPDGDPTRHRLQNIFNKHRDETAPHQEAASLPEAPAGNEPAIPVIQPKRETASSPPTQPGRNHPPEIASDLAQGGQLSESVGAASVTEAAEPRTDDIQEVRELGQVRESPEPHEPHLQALPLEAVWEVQTTRQPQRNSPPLPVETGKHTLSGEGPVRQEESVKPEPIPPESAVPHGDFVRSALEDVQTAQATDSGIEFIPPRRPRPVPAPAGTNATALENSEPSDETFQGVLQRRIDTGHQDETVTSSLVPTEIGPLPEDLWNLVGAAPPPVREEAPHKLSAVGNASELVEQPSPLDETPLRAAYPVQRSQPPVVQRQAASAPSAIEPGSAPPAAGEDTVREQAGEDMDIEELARQVFSELRYRLELEWERLRHR